MAKKKPKHRRTVLLYCAGPDGVQNKLIGLAELTFRKETLRVIRPLNVQLPMKDDDYVWWQARLRQKIKIDAVPAHIRESLAYA